MRREFGDPLEIRGWKSTGKIRRKVGLSIDGKMLKFTEHWTEMERAREKKGRKMAERFNKHLKSKVGVPPPSPPAPKKSQLIH